MENPSLNPSTDYYLSNNSQICVSNANNTSSSSLFKYGHRVIGLFLITFGFVGFVGSNKFTQDVLAIRVTLGILSIGLLGLGVFVMTEKKMEIS